MVVFLDAQESVKVRQGKLVGGKKLPQVPSSGRGAIKINLVSSIKVSKQWSLSTKIQM